MAVQTTYNRRMPIGVNGGPATMHGYDADTKQCESESIGFGLAVSAGAAWNGVVKGGSTFVGIAVRDITLVHSTVDRYEERDNMAVASRGDWWITVEDAVEAYTAVTYNASTGQLGSSGGTAIAGAHWVTSADAGGLAIVRLATGAVELTS